MIKLFNKAIWPLTLGVAVIFTATVVFAGVSRYSSDVSSIEPNANKDTCILKTKSDSLAYIHEHIDKNNNGMPDDVEFGTDSI